MEEKKRRPRLKTDTDSPLEERNESTNSTESSENQSPPFERKPYEDRRQEGSDERRPFQNRRQEGSSERRPFQDRRQEGSSERRPYQDRRQEGSDERRPFQDRRQEGSSERRPYQDRRQEGSDERRPFQDRRQEGSSERRPFQDRRQEGSSERRPYQDRRQEGGGDRKPWQKSGAFGNKSVGRKPFRKKDDFFVERKPKPGLPSGEGMPLNKYLAHCGVASRRKSVDFITEGKVLVNNVVKTEPYYRIQAGDVVICDSKLVSVQERQVYVLLNKPKNIITSTDDEHGRPTVLNIVDPGFPERLFPVGRLDRDTTGLILITNDGDLAQKLTHPSYAVHKQYRVGLRSSLTQADLEHIERGVELDDGLMEINWIRFSEDHPNRDIVELEITSGRNRIVRRLFEHLGYEVFKLDRFYFAGLTKKDLPRGSFRELTQREVIMLKHFTGHPSGKKRKKEDAEAPDDTAPDADNTPQDIV